MNNHNELIVAIDLNFTQENNTQENYTQENNNKIITVNGIYDVHNGYSNKIWGNCSDINEHN